MNRRVCVRSTTIGVRLNVAELERLDVLAARSGRTRSQVVRLLLLGVELTEPKLRVRDMEGGNT